MYNFSYLPVSVFIFLLPLMYWLKTTQIYSHSSGGQKSNIRVLAAFLLEVSGGDYVSLFVVPSRECLHFLTHGHFLHHKMYHYRLDFHHPLTFLCVNLPLSPSIKNICDYIGPTEIIHNHLHILKLSITTARSLLPYEIT